MTPEVNWIEGTTETDIHATVEQAIAEAEQLEARSTEARLTRLSVSRVNTFLRCPRSFYYHYVEQLDTPPGSALCEGKALHAALAIAHTEQKAKYAVPPLDLLLDAHADVWKDEQKEVGSWDKDDTPASVDRRGKTFLKQYYEDHLPHVIPTAVEMGFETMLGGYRVIGYIDLIDRDTIVDHKVVARAVKADFSKQLMLYSFVTGTTKARFNLFKKLKKPVIDTTEATFHDGHFQRLSKLFSDVGQAIQMCYRQGHFPRCDWEQSWMCNRQRCGYFERCWRQ